MIPRLAYSCKFCDQDTEYKRTYFDKLVYFCEHCTAFYEVHIDTGIMTSYRLYNDDYLAFFLANGSFLLKFRDEIIFKLNFWPTNITPDNLLQKSIMYTLLS